MHSKLPTLMRRARQLVMQQSYEEATTTYQTILQCDGMQDSMDIRLRLAWCYEQTEAWGDACAMYKHVIQLYQQQGNDVSAQALQEKIQGLHHRAETDAKAKHISPSLQQQTALDFPALLNRLKDMGDVRTLAAGEVLCEAGEPSTVMWLLEEGVLGVQLPDYLLDGEDILTATDELSVLVGELGFFTRQRRSAKVWAKQACRLVQISIQAMDSCQDIPFKLAMSELLKQYWMYPILSKHSIFERMNDIDRRALCDLFTPIDLPSGMSLIQHGEDHDGAYLLQQGCLFFVYASETGQQQLSSMFPGDMVHLGGLLNAYRADYEVRTATNVRLLHLSRHHINDFLKNRPWMVDVLLRYSRRAAWRQVMRPDDAYLWKTNREIHQRKVRLNHDD